MRQALGVVGDLGRGAPLGTDRVAGRVAGERFHPDQTPITNGVERSAARAAERAIAGNLTGAHAGAQVASARARPRPAKVQPIVPSTKSPVTSLRSEGARPSDK